MRVDGRLREMRVLRITGVYAGTGADDLGLRKGDYLLAVRTSARGTNEGGWRPIQGMGELIALLRSPDFDSETENIWLLRGERGFQGRLVLDDPTVELHN